MRTIGHKRSHANVGMLGHLLPANFRSKSVEQGLGLLTTANSKMSEYKRGQFSFEFSKN